MLQNALTPDRQRDGLALEKAAFNPVISEALDRANGIYHRDSGDYGAGRHAGCRSSSA